MTKFTPKEAELILQAMRNKGVNLNCPRCGNPNFDLIDGYYNLFENEDISSSVTTGTLVPAVIFYCKRCGFLTHHALYILGLKKVDGELKRE